MKITINGRDVYFTKGSICNICSWDEYNNLYRNYHRDFRNETINSKRDLLRSKLDEDVARLTRPNVELSGGDLYICSSCLLEMVNALKLMEFEINA